MIRKKTAFTFLLLANFFLLAHVVVPHHHHLRQVCLERIHCENEPLTPNHSTSEHRHGHDGSDGSEECVLKQAVVIPGNSLKQGLKWNDIAGKTFRYSDFQAILTVIPELAVQKNSQKAQIFPAYFTQAFFVFSSLSLRAPPTV